MRDNEIIIAIRAALIGRLQTRGIVAEVLQAYQPTQQGMAEGAAIYLHKIADRRYGFPERRDVYNPATLQFDSLESSQMESTWQFSANVPQNPADDAQLTNADVVKAAAFAFQSDTVLGALRQAGLGVLRITSIRTLQVVDDRGNFQANPSFDVTFTHRDSTLDVTPVVDTQEVIINRV